MEMKNEKKIYQDKDKETINLVSENKEATSLDMSLEEFISKNQGR